MSRGGKRDGAGRPPKYGETLKYILLGFPKSWVQKLDQIAKKENKPRNKVIIDRFK